MTVVAVDYDHTIHHNGEPIRNVGLVLKHLKQLKYVIVVYTVNPLHREIRRFLLKNDIPFDRITSRKPEADVYVDDRAIQFKGNWLQTMHEIKDFKSWHQK